MTQEILYDSKFHSRIDYEIYGLCEPTSKHPYEFVGYELKVFNPARYDELSELLGVQITNNDSVVISCKDFKKFKKFVSDPTRHYIGIFGDK